jgi:hypothetical protein
MWVESVDPVGVQVKHCVLISHLHHRSNGCAKLRD